MKKQFFILAALLVLAVVIIGCTDGAEKTDDASGEESGEEKTNDVEAANEVVKSTSGNDLSALLGSKSVKYTAEYEMTAEGETQKWIQIFDLPNYATIMRFPGYETRMIFKDSTMYTCNNMDEEWRCMKLATIDSNANDKLESDVKEGIAKPVYVGTCSRAGLSGEKYTVTSEGITSTVCYTKKGIMLEMESDNVKMYATKVSDSVDSAMFDLPVEPEDFSTMIPEGIPGFE